MGAPKLTKLALWGDAKAYQEGRAYRHPATGVQYPSVTTILKMSSKDAIVQWAVDRTVDWCIENLDMLYTKSVEQGKGIARYRHRDVLNERADVGTGVHETIEAEHTGSWNYPVLDDEQREIMVQWELMKKEHHIKALLTEFTVFDAKNKNMGTADGYWEITCQHEPNDKGVDCFGDKYSVPHFVIIDVKTSRNTWDEHRMQLGALWGAKEWLIQTGDMEWTPEAPRQVDGVALIHLRAAERDKFGNVTRPAIRDIIPVGHVDLWYEEFSGFATAWHARQAIKDIEKREALKTEGF